ncbi:hypothetical protein [Priestia megaterium]
MNEEAIKRIKNGNAKTEEWCKKYYNIRVDIMFITITPHSFLSR